MLQCSSLSDDSTVLVLSWFLASYLLAVVVSYIGYTVTIDSSMLRRFVTLVASYGVLTYSDDNDAGTYLLTTWSVVPSPLGLMSE